MNVPDANRRVDIVWGVFGGLWLFVLSAVRLFTVFVLVVIAVRD